MTMDIYERIEKIAKQITAGELELDEKKLRNAINEEVKELLPENFLEDFTILPSSHSDFDKEIKVASLKDISPRVFRALSVGRNIYDNVCFSRQSLMNMGVIGLLKGDDPEKIKSRSIRLSAVQHVHFSCPDCGNADVYTIDMNAKTLSPREEANHACPARELKHDWQGITLPVPSGRVVIANDLRDVVKGGRKSLDEQEKAYAKQFGMSYFSIDSKLGSYVNNVLMRDNGILYIYVGNSSPTIYKDDKSIVAGYNLESMEELLYDDPDNEELKSDFETLSSMQALDSVTTDLWAINFMDYDVFVENCHENGQNPEMLLDDLDAIVTDVPSQSITLPGSIYEDEHNIHDRSILFKLSMLPENKPIKLPTP